MSATPTNQNKIEMTVGFIGCGNMAKAIAFPLLEQGILDPAKVIVSATSDRNLKDWEALGCTTTTKNVDVFKRATILVWSVKPQIFPGAITSLTQEAISTKVRLVHHIEESHYQFHISIMAGVTLATFQSYVEKLVRKEAVVRCFRTMPNIGLKVGCGVTVYAGDKETDEIERDVVESLFKPTGLCYEVPEHLMNAYSALFGSGIGFMFPIIEALSDGGVKQGIPRAVSLEMAAQVMKGAGELILKEKLHPGPLKDSVCSPGGSTICGVAAMEAGGVRSAMIAAVEATTKRNEELGALAVAKK